MANQFALLANIWKTDSLVQTFTAIHTPAHDITIKQIFIHYKRHNLLKMDHLITVVIGWYQFSDLFLEYACNTKADNMI